MEVTYQYSYMHNAIEEDGGNNEEEYAYDTNDNTAEQPITWQERRWRNRR